MGGTEAIKNFDYSIDPYMSASLPMSADSNGNVNNDNPLWNRMQKIYDTEVPAYYNSTNTQMGVENNPEAMSHLTAELESSNSLFCKMTGINRTNITPILDGKDPAKIVGVVKTYGKQKGNPSALINDVENFWTFCLAELQHNKDVDLIADAAIETRDGYTASLLVKEAADGWGANTKVLKKLFLDSKDKMTEQEYNRFLVNTSEEFKKISDNREMTDFVESQYSRTHIRFGSINIGGTSDIGQKFVNAINSAYSNNESMGKNTSTAPLMMYGMI